MATVLIETNMWDFM